LNNDFRILRACRKGDKEKQEGNSLAHGHMKLPFLFV
jgi:hypothetical protein